MNDAKKKALKTESPIDRYYNQSVTMRVLSRQCLNNGLNDDPEKIAELDDLLSASRINNDWSWMDFYNLGVIHGKQVERRKQKSK